MSSMRNFTYESFKEKEKGYMFGIKEFTREEIAKMSSAEYTRKSNMPHVRQHVEKLSWATFDRVIIRGIPDPKSSVGKFI